MSRVATVDLFAEDYGHEALLKPLLQRLASELGKEIDVRVRSARGGRGRVLSELRGYQTSVLQGAIDLPDFLIVGIDANCKTYNGIRGEIDECLETAFHERTAYACPDPHVERWYLADSRAFHSVVGPMPELPKQKCERDVYKTALAQAVIGAGHLATLGGLEFGPEIAATMDPYRVGRQDRSFKHFLDDVIPRLKAL